MIGVCRGWNQRNCWEGLNIERISRMSSSREEQGRLNTSDRGTTEQTKWVKPVGVVQRVEPSPARDR